MSQSIPTVPAPNGPNNQPPRLPRPVGAPPLPIPLPPSQTSLMQQNAPTPPLQHRQTFNRPQIPPQIPPQQQHRQPPKETNWMAVVDNPKEKNVPTDEIIDTASFAVVEENFQSSGAGAEAAAQAGAVAHAVYSTQPQHSDSEDSESSNRSGEPDDLKMNKFAERIVLKLGSKYPTSPRFIFHGFFFNIL